MNFFWKANEVSFFSDEQVYEGLSDGLTPLTHEEMLKHTTPPMSLFHTLWDDSTNEWLDPRTNDELVEYARSQMPNLTKREFRKKLRDAQLFEQVENYVKASNDGYLQDAWEYADYFARLDPFIVSSCEKLGLSPEQVDSIWVSE